MQSLFYHGIHNSSLYLVALRYFWTSGSILSPRASSDLAYNNFLWRFIFATGFFDLSFRELFKSTLLLSYFHLDLGRSFSTFWLWMQCHKYLRFFQRETIFTWVIFVWTIAKPTAPKPKKMNYLNIMLILLKMWIMKINNPFRAAKAAIIDYV